MLYIVLVLPFPKEHSKLEKILKGKQNQFSYGVLGDLSEDTVHPFPKSKMSECFTPLSHCWAQEAVPLAGTWVNVGSWRTPNPPGTPLPPSHPGELKHGMRGEPRHTRAGGGQCLCPKGSRRSQGAIPRKGALSPLTLLLLPYEAIFQALQVVGPAPDKRHTRAG